MKSEREGVPETAGKSNRKIVATPFSFAFAKAFERSVVNNEGCVPCNISPLT